MSYYLIGIGGTGARCMEAFIHLNGAGLLNDGQPVRTVYVDADVSCGNLSRAQETALYYEEARKLGFPSDGIFQNDLEAGRNDVWTPVEEKKDNLDDVFAYSTMTTTDRYKSLGHLYEALYTEQERTTNLDKGFRGHPAIGAAVMNEKMNPQEQPWKDLLPQINSDKDPKIFLIASVFGGTGAAGFPTIAKLLDEELQKDDDGKCIAKIGGALVLPYFQFPAADQAALKEMQAKVEEFMLNTQSALRYYDNSGLVGTDENGVFTNIYMVGDNDFTKVSKFSLGAKDQKNEANIVEIYAALAAFDFFNKKDYERGEVPMIARKDNETITWEDLPNVCRNGSGTLKERFSTYIRFLYTFKYSVFPELQEIAKDESHAKEVAWYINLVQKAGVDVYEDRDGVMEKFKALDDYATNFFVWMNDVISNKNRKIELVDPRACKLSCEYKEEKVSRWNFFRKGKQKVRQFFKLDIYQVVLPVSEKKDKLDGKVFWNKLCSQKFKGGSGPNVLLQAVEDICRG